MWEEDVPYKGRTGEDSGDKKSIKHCDNSGYKYFIHYISGLPYDSSDIIDNRTSHSVVSIK